MGYDASSPPWAAEQSWAGILEGTPFEVGVNDAQLPDTNELGND